MINDSSSLQKIYLRADLFIRVGAETGIDPSVQVVERLVQFLGLCVTVGDFSLDLHLGVGQPAGNLLHEDKVHHMVLEPGELNECIKITFS